LACFHKACQSKSSESVSGEGTDMRKSRLTDEQIVGFLKQAEVGLLVKDLCRRGGFSDAIFYKWRARFGGVEASDARMLREVQAENTKLIPALPGVSNEGELARRIDVGPVLQFRGHGLR